MQLSKRRVFVALIKKKWNKVNFLGYLSVWIYFYYYYLKLNNNNNFFSSVRSFFFLYTQNNLFFLTWRGSFLCYYFFNYKTIFNNFFNEWYLIKYWRRYYYNFLIFKNKMNCSYWQIFVVSQKIWINKFQNIIANGGDIYFFFNTMQEFFLYKLTYAYKYNYFFLKIEYILRKQKKMYQFKEIWLRFFFSNIFYFEYCIVFFILFVYKILYRLFMNSYFWLQYCLINILEHCLQSLVYYWWVHWIKKCSRFGFKWLIFSYNWLFIYLNYFLLFNYMYIYASLSNFFFFNFNLYVYAIRTGITQRIVYHIYIYVKYIRKRFYLHNGVTDLVQSIILVDMQVLSNSFASNNYYFNYIWRKFSFGLWFGIYTHILLKHYYFFIFLDIIYLFNFVCYQFIIFFFKNNFIFFHLFYQVQFYLLKFKLNIKKYLNYICLNLNYFFFSYLNKFLIKTRVIISCLRKKIIYIALYPTNVVYWYYCLIGICRFDVKLQQDSIRKKFLIFRWVFTIILFFKSIVFAPKYILLKLFFISKFLVYFYYKLFLFIFYKKIYFIKFFIYQWLQKFLFLLWDQYFKIFYYYNNFIGGSSSFLLEFFFTYQWKYYKNIKKIIFYRFFWWGLYKAALLDGKNE